MIQDPALHFHLKDTYQNTIATGLLWRAKTDTWSRMWENVSWHDDLSLSAKQSSQYTEAEDEADSSEEHYFASDNDLDDTEVDMMEWEIHSDLDEIDEIEQMLLPLAIASPSNS